MRYSAAAHAGCRSQQVCHLVQVDLHNGKGESELVSRVCTELDVLENALLSCIVRKITCGVAGLCDARVQKVQTITESRKMSKRDNIAQEAKPSTDHAWIARGTTPASMAARSKRSRICACLDLLLADSILTVFAFIPKSFQNALPPKIAAKSACWRQELNDAHALRYELTSATDMGKIHTVCFAGSSGTVGHDQSVAAVQDSLQGVS